MTNEITKRIHDGLDSIEAEMNVRIIYACESGSRAWGFESEDSDYDVRFIYVRRTSWYLSIQPRRDVIERPIENDLDICGWDLTKTLSLLRKSNPPLLEWLQSPIVYRETESATSRIRRLIPDYYSPISCMYHYLNMAEGNYREYLRGDEVRVKKYFYVLRPVLACLWIERGLGVVPTEFAKLVDAVAGNSQLRDAINCLVVAKKAGRELDRGPRIPVISDFLDAEVGRLSAANMRSANKRDPAELDRTFTDILTELNGPLIANEEADD